MHLNIKRPTFTCPRPVLCRYCYSRSFVSQKSFFSDYSAASIHVKTKMFQSPIPWPHKTYFLVVNVFQIHNTVLYSRFQFAAGGVPVWASIDSCEACETGRCALR